MHAVLYHHGVPDTHASCSRSLTANGSPRLKLPAAAREQLTIALEMIDAIELQVGPRRSSHCVPMPVSTPGAAR